MTDDRANSFSRVRERLDEIVIQIRSRDVPLEKSLDLYEEALRLGSLAAELIDNADFSSEELLAGVFEDLSADENEAEAEDGADPADPAEDNANADANADADPAGQSESTD